MMRQNLPGPEFTRPIEVARVAKLGSHEKISADPPECAALAKRYKVPAVHAVRAHLQAKPWRGGGLKVWGEAVIELTQESVISLEAFQTSQTIVVERYYLASTPDDLVGSELEIDPIEAGIVDLGELVAESIALELDLYPRKPGEVFQVESLEQDSIEEKKPNPFNVLKLPERKR